MPVIYDDRWIGRHGIGRFAMEVRVGKSLGFFGVEGQPSSPADPFRLAWAFYRHRDTLSWFFSPGYNCPIWGKMPCVLTIHDLNHIDRLENSSLLKRLYYSVVLKRLCRRARGIITVSEFSKQRLAQWAGIDLAKIYVVGNGVSSLFSNIGDSGPIDGPYVLCVSNRKGHKNEEGLLRAYAASNIHTDVKLVFTGSPNKGLQTLCKSLNIMSQVVFLGSVNDTELAAVYRGATIMALPSYYEGFCLPIIEAFASGVPVITSNCSAMPEIAGDAALLVDPYNIPDISKALEDLYRDNDLRSYLITRGLLRSRIFTWDQVRIKLMAAFQDMCLKVN